MKNHHTVICQGEAVGVGEEALLPYPLLRVVLGMEFPFEPVRFLYQTIVQQLGGLNSITTRFHSVSNLGSISASETAVLPIVARGAL